MPSPAGRRNPDRATAPPTGAQSTSEQRHERVDVDWVTSKLPEEGVQAFSDSFDKLLADIETKRAKSAEWRPVSAPDDRSGPRLARPKA